MAVTKIWPVKGRLDHLINYVENPKKTEQQLFATRINCTPASAVAEMNATKQLFGKPGGTVAFHGYQSFSPGEVMPEIAHEIGTRLARELWGDRFQIVVTTHLDKGHIHNHIAINSVGFADGLRFHSDAQEYHRMRSCSDRLCREYGLSIIENPKPGKAQHYAEWKAEREGNQTWRGLVKADVDAAIGRAVTDKQFYTNLRAIGYDIKTGKDISVRPPGKERFVRLARNFGEDYSYEGIARRILAQRQSLPMIKKPQRTSTARQKKAALPKGSIAALYRHYLYLFDAYPKQGGSNERMHFLLREDLRALSHLTQELDLLTREGIEEPQQLESFTQMTSGHIGELTQERTSIRKLEKKGGQENPRANEINVQLKKLRKEIRLCESIRKRSAELPSRIEQIEHDDTAKAEKEVRDGRIGSGGRAGREDDALR